MAKSSIDGILCVPLGKELQRRLLENPICVMASRDFTT